MPTTDFYERLGRRSVKSGISFDLSVFGPEFKDLATVEPLATLTGGQVTYYADFNARVDGRRFIYDLHGRLHRQVAFNSTLTVSHSRQLKGLATYSGGLLENGKLFGNFDSRSAAQFEFDLTDDFGANADAHFQASWRLKRSIDRVFQIAVFYSTPEGDRRVRVLNLRLSTTENFEEIYSAMDVSSMVRL